VSRTVKGLNTVKTVKELSQQVDALRPRHTTHCAPARQRARKVIPMCRESCALRRLQTERARADAATGESNPGGSCASMLLLGPLWWLGLAATAARQHRVMMISGALVTIAITALAIIQCPPHPAPGGEAMARRQNPSG
jgi:hypothetical protein